MNQSTKKSDRLYCANCRFRLLEQMVPAGTLVAYSGVAGMYCVQCDEMTPLYPRRLPAAQSNGFTAEQGVKVVDACRICARTISTSFRRGTGERDLFCDAHPADDRAQWYADKNGVCSTEGCTRKATSRGRCNPHYSQWYRAQATANRRATRAMGWEDASNS